LSQKLLVVFLTFDSWNRLGGTKNDVYRRRLPHYVDLSRHKIKKKMSAFSPKTPGRELRPLPVRLKSTE